MTWGNDWPEQCSDTVRSSMQIAVQASWQQRSIDISRRFAIDLFTLACYWIVYVSSSGVLDCELGRGAGHLA